MKKVALGVAVVLMAGTVARADEPPGWLAEYMKQLHKAPAGKHVKKLTSTAPAQIAEAEAQAAAQGKTREQLNEMVQDVSDRRDEERSRLEITEATLTKLRDIRDAAKDGEQVRLEFGVPTLHGGKQTFRNIGVGRAPDDERLMEIERKLDRVLKKLEDMKRQQQGAFNFPIGAFY